DLAATSGGQRLVDALDVVGIDRRRARPRIEPRQEGMPFRAHVHARELDLVVPYLELRRYALAVAGARLEFRDDSHAGIIEVRDSAGTRTRLSRRTAAMRPT